LKLSGIAFALTALVAAAACGGSSDNAPTGPQVTSLVIEDLVVGTGATAVAGDTLTVRYVGTFLDGRQFDAGTFSFRLGAGQVIAGFDQGVTGMKVGGRRRLTIPSDLAYGSRGQGSIPPNTPLRFEIELVSIAGK
jgi:FKBP-type peptidyl-prolyl cis-trans isomerase FkpA